MDANMNRAREGLRVCEDVCRFLRGDKAATARYKRLRHRLTAAAKALGLRDLIGARDVNSDIGRPTSAPERRRGNAEDIYFANSQRVKESVRVLEEVAKLVDRSLAERLKRVRYEVYAIEKDVAKRF